MKEKEQVTKEECLRELEILERAAKGEDIPEIIVEGSMNIIKRFIIGKHRVMSHGYAPFPETEEKE